MSHDHILPGFTDAGAHCRHLAFFDGALSLLRQAVSTGFMTPQRAIERVTGEPARWFNLKTGTLKVGAPADVVLLNPDALRAPIPEPIEVEDRTIQDALRMVKRGSEEAVAAVFIRGAQVVADGVPLATLGAQPLGTTMTPTTSADDVLARHRNRIDDRTVDHPFSSYWDVFVLKHRNALNVALHCVGVVLLWAIPAWALLAGNPWLLLALPISQGLGLAGHRLFEQSYVDTRDAIFSWRAVLALHRLFLEVVTGRYPAHVRRLTAQLEAWQRR